MDRSQVDACRRTLDAAGLKGLEHDGGAGESRRSPRLPRKRAESAGVHNATQPLPSADEPFDGRPTGDAAARRGSRARKGSLRMAVRKIFGRRSKEVEPPPLRSSAHRHGYHISDPVTLAPHTEAPDLPSPREDAAPPRPPSARRPSEPAAEPASPPPMRSPYAVEFPRSARLKPLDLGNPFAPPGSPLRRRKTLPSILVADADRARLSAAVGSAEPPPIPSLDIHRDAPAAAAGPALTVGSTRAAKRASRSAENMRATLPDRAPVRKRSEEIRYWRESLQGSVVRASGFVSQAPRDDAGAEYGGDTTPTGLPADPFHTAAGSSSMPGSTQRPGPAWSGADGGSVSGFGTELSKDLEDRVAKLEAGLQSFQTSLQRMQAERERHTVMVGGLSRRRAASNGPRTPSMLADTLADFDPPHSSSSPYDYEEPLPPRPSTSPQPLPPPSGVARPAVPPIPDAHARPAPGRFGSSPPPIMAPLLPAAPPAAAARGADSIISGTGSSGEPPREEEHTFTSLFEMLADERAARRRLESQLHGLQQELSALHYQVSVGSNLHSQRNSNSFSPRDPLAGGGGGGSSRLRELLRDTAATPPRAQRDSGATGFSSNPDRVVSRFSGSDSEGGGAPHVESDSEELTTPYEAYLTPTEEGGRFPLDDSRPREGAMF